jgi:hypothetical protein
MRLAYFAWLAALTIAACHSIAGLDELEVVPSSGAGGTGVSSGGGEGATGPGSGGFGGMSSTTTTTTTSTSVGGGPPCTVEALDVTADGDINDGNIAGGGTFPNAFVGDEAGDTYRGLFRFPRPADGTFVAAELCATGLSIGDKLNIDLHAILGMWEEGTLNWDTSWGTAGGNITGVIASGTGPEPGPSNEVCYDLTAFYAGNPPDPIYGFMLIAQTPTFGSHAVYKTREDSPPHAQLRVTRCP